jgi:hypothetical protein
MSEFIDGIPWLAPSPDAHLRLTFDKAKPLGERCSISVWSRPLAFICDVPKALGLPTKLEVRNGKVICHTESGIEMIVPNGSCRDAAL